VGEGELQGDAEADAAVVGSGGAASPAERTLSIVEQSREGSGAAGTVARMSGRQGRPRQSSVKKRPRAGRHRTLDLYMSAREC